MVVETPDAERIVLLKAPRDGDDNDAQVQIQEKREHDEDSYCCCLRWRRSGHWCCAFTTILVMGAISFLVCAVVLPLDKAAQIASYAVLPLTYFVYWIEVLCGGTFRYLRHFNPEENLVNYIGRIRSNRPKLSFNCECYHHETRTRVRTETYRDANGNTQTRTRTETYQEKVVTYRGHEHFHYDAWEDRTPGLSSAVLRCKVMRMDFSKALSFTDSYSENCFEEQWTEFKQKYKHRDTHFHSWQEHKIKGFHPHMMTLVEGAKRPFFMRWSVYLLCSLCLLTWPYRLIVDRTTVKGKFQFQKCVRKIPV